MTLICQNCGHEGDEAEFKNGPRGRKLHSECNKCRNELSTLVDQRSQLHTYLTKYRSAHIAISIGGEILENFKKMELTPSYLSNGEFRGTLHDSHFVPIANLAYEHALNDIKNDLNLRPDVEKALGEISSVDKGDTNLKRGWNRANLLAEIEIYTSIPTGSGTKDASTPTKTSKNLFRRLLGL